MRVTSHSSFQFAPGDPGSINDVQNLLRYVRDLEDRLVMALGSLATGHKDKVYSPPDKPRDGDLAYADGVMWNPGAGQGMYYYNGDAATWIQLG